MTIVVGLTGGIACGKSTVASGFVARGADLIDADVIARELVEPGTPGLALIAAAFGSDVVGLDGRLKRAALGVIVFADPPLLERLNGILHPAIEAEIAARIQHARLIDAPVVIVDAALLVELGLTTYCDKVVVVTAPVDVQVQRLMARDGLPQEQARQRVAAQSSHAERLAHADVHIDNNQGLDELAARIEAAWAALQAAEDGDHQAQNGR